MRAPRFAPGQFNMLYLFGAGEAAISISGAPARPQTLVHTIRGVGSVTAPLLRARRGEIARSARSLRQRVAGGRSGKLRMRRCCCSRAESGCAPLRPVIYEVLRAPPRLRPADRFVRRADARRSALSQGTHAMAHAAQATVKVIVDRAAHGLERTGRRADRSAGRGRIRSRGNHRDGLRSGGDDALCRIGNWCAAGFPRGASTCRWSAT